MIAEHAIHENIDTRISRPGRTPTSRNECIRILRLVAKETQTTDVTTSMYHTWRMSRMNPLDYPTYRTIANRFGDWAKALVQAGLIEPTVTELAEKKLQKTIQALNAYATRHGFPTQPDWDTYAREQGLLRARALMERTERSWVDYRKQFDGKLDRPEKYSEQDCVRFIRECARELSKPVSRLVYDDYKTWSLEHKDAPSIATLTARFGWKNIKTRAGQRTQESEQTTLFL